MKYKSFAEALKQVREDGHTDVASAIRKCKTTIEDASQLLSKLQGMDPEGGLPSWWNSKLAIASDSMNKLRLPLIKKAYEFQEEAKSKILSNNILTEDNYKVLISPKMNLLNLKYYPLRDGILMDRRGRN